jgi:hypothetical protein
VTQYLFSRAEGAPRTSLPADRIGGTVFFQMWKTRKDPFNVLSEGDTLWWTDQKTRQVRWELRARNIRRDRYTSTAAALERLRRWFGVLPSELTTYHNHANPEGWLLAFEAEVVGPVDCILSGAHKLGRNGFARIDQESAREMGLPQSGRPAAFPIKTEPEEPGVLAPSRVRHIPRVVKEEVFDRDGHICQLCGTTEGPMHLDHIHPWSKGGSNTVDNLQVLCAPCNASKGAAAVEGRAHVPAVGSLVALAHTVDQPVPSTPLELSALLAKATTAGLDDSITEVAWDLFHHVNFEGEIYEATAEGLDGAAGQLGALRDLIDALELFHTEEFNAEGILELAQTVKSSSPTIATRAAAYLSISDAPEARRLELARIGLESLDVRVQAVASYVIADLSTDDALWADRMLFAIEHGDAAISSAAAGDFGTQLEDDRLAYFYLEQALRSPVLEVARNAAASIAVLFADDEEVARVYARRAEEIDSLIGS